MAAFDARRFQEKEILDDERTVAGAQGAFSERMPERKKDGKTQDDREVSDRADIHVFSCLGA
jgi:hypothetical protein